MSKDWEKETQDWLRDYGLSNESAYTAEEVADTVEEAVKYFSAKQRTKLLARVREEVIGKADIEYTMVDKPKETILKYSTRDNYYNPVRNQLRKEQLKELEIISEEGK